MKLAVTGAGALCAIGEGYEAIRRALDAPERAIDAAYEGPSVALDAARFPTTYTAEVRGFDPNRWLGDKGHRNFDRLTKLMIASAGETLRLSGLKRDGAFVGVSPERIGLCSATAYGSLDAITELNRVAELEDPRYINPARFPNTVINAAAGYVSIWEQLRGPNSTIVDGNCGALDAVLTAATHLEHRRADVFLVGGGEVVTEPLCVAMDKLGLLRVPKGSTGLAPGEGAAYLAVERLEHAEARGAKPSAYLSGYGMSYEAPPREALLHHVSRRAIARAIESAMSEAGLSKGEVDLVLSAEDGIVPHDAEERAGIVDAVGDVPIVAPKRFFGETFGAAGALGMVAALACFDGAPIGALAEHPPERVERIVVTAVGFYGNVSAVVMTRAI